MAALPAVRARIGPKVGVRGVRHAFSKVESERGHLEKRMRRKPYELKNRSDMYFLSLRRAQ